MKQSAVNSRAQQNNTNNGIKIESKARKREEEWENETASRVILYSTANSFI